MLPETNVELLIWILWSHVSSLGLLSKIANLSDELFIVKSDISGYRILFFFSNISNIHQNNSAKCLSAYIWSHYNILHTWNREPKTPRSSTAASVRLSCAAVSTTLPVYIIVKCVHLGQLDLSWLDWTQLYTQGCSALLSHLWNAQSTFFPYRVRGVKTRAT